MSFTIIVIILICVYLILVIDKKIYLNLSNFPGKMSPLVKSNCQFQPKRCPHEGAQCDCQEYCNNKDAKIYKNDINYFCYIPHYYWGCNQEFGTYVFDKHWKCLPKFNGIFTTSGEQIAGKYPHTNANVMLVNHVDYNDPSQYEINCNGLYDEYNNKLIKITLNGGISFCVKDYCLNNITNNPAKGYNLDTGLCDCTENTQNLIVDDKTSPCVVVNTDVDKNIPIKINCYKENQLFMKDMKNYLIPCNGEKDYYTLKDFNFKLVKIHS